MFCPRCGTENGNEYKFCMKCGTQLPEFSSATHPPTTGLNPPVAAPAQSPLNIWGPFAGYGTRRRHVGWLMEGCGDRSEDLIKDILIRFDERKVPGASHKQATLTARGVLVESRPYFIFKRGLVSMGLNISQFGRDLFISIVSYLKPPISYFRVIVAGVMALFAMLNTIIIPVMLRSAVNNAASSLISGYGGSGVLTMLLCFLGPLAAINNLALGAFIVYSLYKWITEKDILAGLRTSANEFNEDDLMAMESSIEQTVRGALGGIGLNPDELKPVEGGSFGL